jgi:hypothetical protein
VQYSNYVNVCYTVGNKCDDPDRRAVVEADGRRLAETMHIPFFETSAKNNIHVEEVSVRIVSLHGVHLHPL